MNRRELLSAILGGSAAGVAATLAGKAAQRLLEAPKPPERATPRLPDPVRDVVPAGLAREAAVSAAVNNAAVAQTAEPPLVTGECAGATPAGGTNTVLL